MTCFGVPVRAGYRIPIDVRWLRARLREVQPDVLETGDPWVSGPLALRFKRQGDFAGVVSSFFHADPVPTYVEPWLTRATRSARLGHTLSDRVSRQFYDRQRRYDVTVASSPGVAERLRQQGIVHVMCAPFGVDARFLDAGRRRLQSPIRDGRRLLFVGRLQRDKGVDVLLAALPVLLDQCGVTVTIAGTGPMSAQIAAYRHPRLHVVGYITNRDQLVETYRAHDVLLAPGPYETFGLAVLEALASGLSVVGPNCGGTGELLSRLPSPCFFEAGHAESFVDAVCRALTGDRAARSEDGVSLARRQGTWSDAIQREVDQYCAFLSRSTT